MSIIIPGIVVVVGLAVVLLVVTARRRATSRATHSDTGETGEAPAGDRGEVARARADETRRAIESGSGVLEPAGKQGVTRYEPIDEEELGVTRRQFFNRGILAGLGLGLAGFGAASLAFLWGSTGAGGFGGRVVVGSKDDIDTAIGEQSFFYNASAKVYIVPFPAEAIPRAEDAYDSRIVAGMEQGYAALYQKCVHLGCRVPFCPSSQWFECPCHGSKYNQVGEKRGGPAPRGLDRFPLEVSGGDIVVDTGALIQGPPIGTDTTQQGQEGAPCV